MEAIEQTPELIKAIKDYEDSRAMFQNALQNANNLINNMNTGFSSVKS